MLYKDEFSHNRKLAGKLLSCEDIRSFDSFFNASLRFTGPAVRATTEKGVYYLSQNMQEGIHVIVVYQNNKFFFINPIY